MDFYGSGIDRIFKNKEEGIIEFVSDLVKIPTVNSPPVGNELPGQLFFMEACRKAGFEIHTVSPEKIRHDSENGIFLEDRSFVNRHNVIGIWKGTGSGRSLLLSGHMDVAPEEPFPWKMTSPFKPLIKNRKLYGRGSADMKGGLTAAFMAARLLKETGWIPAGDIMVESVVDEEFAGANGTIASRLAGFNADFAINPEPTGLVLYPASLGALILKITVSGISGMPYTGVEIYNPAYALAKLIGLMAEYEKIRNENEPSHELWSSVPYKRSVMITKVKAGEAREHGQLGLPIDAWLEAVIQTFPGETEESSMETFSGFISEKTNGLPEFGANKAIIEREYRYVEPSVCVPDNGGIEVFKNSCRNITGNEVKIAGAPFSSDLSAFYKYGSTPAVHFGPAGDNLHGPDEWVDIDSIITVSKVFAQMIVDWCG